MRVRESERERVRERVGAWDTDIAGKRPRFWFNDLNDPKII